MADSGNGGDVKAGHSGNREEEATEVAPATSVGVTSAMSRGFERHYQLNAGGEPGNDLLVRKHPNGLLVVSLAPSHTLLRRGAKRVASVAWREGVADEEAHGKRCKGGANLGPKTKLADAQLVDGAGAVPLLAGVADVRLVELNSRLQEEPRLLQDAPEDEGFLAILQPRRPHDASRSLQGLLSDAAYAAEAARRRGDRVAAGGVEEPAEACVGGVVATGPDWAPAPNAVS
mmetsp:Transcript_48422/g.122145  ORF Transcript_48422/g.122145 Transcript_48422/m.122145 type:complete len:231 (-) Transcript_48422:35-727(-)